MAFRFQLGQGIHRQGLDLGDHHIGPVAPHHVLEGLGIGHGDHFGHLGHGHGRRTGVAVHGDHLAAEALGGDRHLLAQFTAAQQHHPAGEGKGGHRLQQRGY